MDEDEAEYAALRSIPSLVEFAAVARWEHVTRAAEQLGVPQSTLSRRIARLERAVGTPLFVRRGRRLETTRAGRTFALTVDRALRELERGLDDLVRDTDPETGTVVLGFLHTLGAEVVPRILSDFRRSHPGIRFRLVQDGNDGVVAKLRAGTVDVCLTSPLPEEAGVASFALHEQPLCLAVPTGHRLGLHRGIDLSDVAGEQFIGFKPGFGMRRISDEWCRQAGFTPTLAFEGEDVATVRGLVAAGLGVALLPVSSTSRPPGVAEVPVRTPAATRTIGMAWVSDAPSAPPVQAFMNFMLQRGPALVSSGGSEKEQVFPGK